MSTETPKARAHAPGKLILSGEHSVLYGAPALAMGLAIYTEVWFTPLTPGEGLRTAFANLSQGATYPIALLSKFKSTLDRRFDQFVRGDLQVSNILTQPDDLAVYTLASLLQDAPSEKMPGIGAMNALPTPGELASRSDVPIGAGMGSSAAIVAATTVLFEQLLNRPKTPAERQDRVRFCERLKHGKAGPVDAATVVNGGLMRVVEAEHPGAERQVERASLNEDHSLLTGEGWYWVLHGRPECSTGECVSAVAASHGHDSALWEAFGACTKTLEADILAGRAPVAAITENQRLLERIGVVPDATRGLIREIEALGGAAKICGAGAVRGQNGGAVLVRLNDETAMTTLMAQRPGTAWAKLQMAPEGAGAGPAPIPVDGQAR